MEKESKRESKIDRIMTIFAVALVAYGCGNSVIIVVANLIFKIKTTSENLWKWLTTPNVTFSVETIKGWVGKISTGLPR